VPASLPQTQFADKPASDFTSDQNGAQPEGYDDLLRFARLLTAHGVVEVRVLGIGGDKARTAAGWFDDVEALTYEALGYSGGAKGVYATLNPVAPPLLALSTNRLTEGIRRTTRDADVQARRLLLIDVDPRRPADTSATDEEKAKAAQLVGEVRDYLTGLGWPEPVEADSGNGGHLDYLIDLPADDGGLVKRVLRALAERFDTAEAEIDRKVFNAARICKLPGTWSCKGEPTPERPHRLARLLRVPDELVPVPRELLEAVAAEEPPEAQTDAPVRRAKRKKKSVPSGGRVSRPTGSRGWNRDSLIARASAYVAKMPSAKSGRPAAPEEGNDKHGHDQLFCVAATLVRDFDLTVDEARPILQEYSDRCEPPWGEAELEHKLADADTFDGERGRLAREGCTLANYRTETKSVPEADGKGQGGEKEADKTGGRAAKEGHVFLSAAAIAADLSDITGGWPKRVGKALFVPDEDGRPLYLDETAELFAWMRQQVSGDGDSRLIWMQGPGAVTREEFFAHLSLTAERYDSVELYPHEPAIPTVCYMHPPLEGGDGKTLAELLARFGPASAVDADLLKALFVTLVWGGPPGQRPLFCVTSDEDGQPGRGRGVGKSTLVQLAASLVGGSLSVQQQEDWYNVIRRQLSPEARGLRVGLLDNVKSLKFSWSGLEAAVTTDVISGHRMHKGEGRQPNLLTWLVTLNGAALSLDLAQRAIFVQIKRQPYSPTWHQETLQLVDEKRWAILGDLVAELRQGRRLERVRTRWAAWEAAVLACVNDPATAQEVILKRQGEADDDRQEAELVRDEFVRVLAEAGRDADRAVVLFPSLLAAKILSTALNDNKTTNRAMTLLYELSIPEIQRSNRGSGRGCLWRGTLAPPDAKPAKASMTQGGGGRVTVEVTADLPYRHRMVPMQTAS
jgi:hypothetical protein